MFEQLTAWALFRKLRALRDIDDEVVDAMELVARHDFVDDVGARAYSDSALPIGCGQTISQPRMLAHMLTAARVRKSDRVLEVGAGSGYAAAVLSLLAREVVAVERVAALAERARARLARFLNVTLVCGDACADDGVAGVAGPFDLVVVSAGAVDIPRALLRLTKSGGRMIIPVGARTAQGSVDGELCRLTVVDGRVTAHEQLMRCSFVPLVTTTTSGAR